MNIKLITENNIQYTIKIYNNGDRWWYLNSSLHREDGPAIEYANGDKWWYRNGLQHREDGPAIELADGDKLWFLNGERHREDGPAIEYPNGSKYWYLNDKLLPITSDEQFMRMMKLKAFL